MQQYLLGYDLGSSSVKASLVDVAHGNIVASAQSPAEEMPMIALQSGWAEQDPEMWWQHTINSTKMCLEKAGIKGDQVLAIGISYQMHGLVCVDKNQNVVRPSIIWCDSRAVALGDQAYNDLGGDFCLSHFLNSPGNFTASKLRWVKLNEPKVFERIDKVMLPGDYLAMKLSGEINTTDTGLSEGIFWDYKSGKVSSELLDYYDLDSSLIAPQVPVFSVQSQLKQGAADVLGLTPGTKISYRAGDQPNNAFSLNVLNPGEIAATAGTSGVIYGVTDKNSFDSKSRVNTFIHVNNMKSNIRNGVLLCINGTGILNSWLRKNTQSNGEHYAYSKMNSIAGESPIGADGLIILPFGNGAERVLENKNINASFIGLNFNRHTQAHMFRAAQEGIVFALKYGFDVLQQMGLRSEVIRAGHANMFLSPLFREAFVNTIGAGLELYATDGAKGAALGAGVGSGIYADFKEAFKGLKCIDSYQPDDSKKDQYQNAYQKWLHQLNKQL